jgi:RNA polymerase sigma-70 factor (ECF subfamily)
MGPGADARKVTDAEIIELSLDEPGRFGMIFERHAGEILRYIHARLGPDLAQDVLAETFLAAFGRRAHYDRCRAYARPWLYGIAIRQIGRHRRGEQRAARALSARDPQARCLMRSDGIWKRLAALAGLGRLARRMCWWRGLWGGPLMR